MKGRAFGGMSTRDALRLAERLGAQVEEVHRTGEVRVTFPGARPATITGPSRRKDAPRVLVKMLNRRLKELA